MVKEQLWKLVLRNKVNKHEKNNFSKLTFFITNIVFSQINSPHVDLQGSWKNKEYEIEITKDSIKINPKEGKEINLAFLELPKTNKAVEFESWATTGKFKADVVKIGDGENNGYLVQYIYFRIKIKKDKLIFDFSKSMFYNYEDESITFVPERIKKMYNEYGYFVNKIKLSR